MVYNLYNLNASIAREIMKELGDDVFKHLRFNHEDCVDVNLDASLIILKINDQRITIDKAGKLFTIEPTDYEMLVI